MSEKSMDIYDIVMAMLDSEAGIQGRTAIQKLVYLAKEIHSDLDIPEYKPHYYGPFSTGVGEALSELVSYSFVSETIIRESGYVEYGYRLTEHGRSATEDVKKQFHSEYDDIRELVDRCNKSCGLRIHSLSFASKIRFMQTHKLHEDCSMTEEYIKERGRDLGWKITDQDIDGGIKLLKDLGLDPSR